ncbi:MAG: hypothetical protein GY790_02120 [Bacteroidetes bacterium]|nr:hypothetical protein [Bacteroidota bacterium]
MKRNNLIHSAFCLVALTLLTISCSKENIPEINESKLSVLLEDADDALILEEILDEVMEDLERYEYFKSSDVCPVKTIETPGEAVYPKIVTKDYGSGCSEYESGIIRSGKIIITIKGPWRQEGSIRTITFENYMHGNTLIEGSKKIECMGLSDEGYIWHTIKGKLVLSRERDGEKLVIERHVTKDRYLIDGFNDREVPNQWLIEGKVKVEKSNGVSYKVIISEPLYRIQGCRWFQSGIKRIETVNNLIFLDYGYVGDEDSACDSWILRTVNEEEDEAIDLNNKR